MKKVIYCDSRPALVDTIVRGFESTAQVTSATPIEITDNYVQLELVGPGIPNGRTTTTVWYTYKNVNNGKVEQTRLLEWSSDYQVQSDGTVLDSSGQVIGIAKVVHKTGEMIQRTRKNFSKKSVRTDSGDVLIDHPEKLKSRKIYQDVVDSLVTRKVTHRS